jgi:hypothetical protein
MDPGFLVLIDFIKLGYCANLAYVIHINAFCPSAEKESCHFGMVLFGIALFGLYLDIAEEQIWIVRSSSLTMTSIFLRF